MVKSQTLAMSFNSYKLEILVLVMGTSFTYYIVITLGINVLFVIPFVALNNYIVLALCQRLFWLLYIY